MDKINITGEYEYIIHIPTMFHDYSTVILKKHNLITSAGVDYFLKRWITNDVDLIKNIIVGTGTNLPRKDDVLFTGNSATPNLSSDSSTNSIILKATFNSNRINGTTEIGVATSNGVLISRDVHEKIDIPITSTFTIVYTYKLNTLSISTGWTKSQGYVNTYQTTNLNNIIGVTEEDNNTGYQNVLGAFKVDKTDSSYYYDTINNLVYIHTSDGLNPSNHKISLKYAEGTNE